MNDREAIESMRRDLAEATWWQFPLVAGGIVLGATLGTLMFFWDVFFAPFFERKK